MDNVKWIQRCGHCGKFVGNNFEDSYVPFGSYDDLEPPDEVFLCASCVDKDMEYFRNLKRMPDRWVPARYENILAKELGYERVEGAPGAAWSIWKKIKGEE